MSAAICVEDLHVDYPSKRGPLRVLDGLCLQIEEGEFFSLVGPSGCGKTTLLHVLAGLSQPLSGHIAIDRAQTALVFQRPTLLPWRTILGNVLFGLECRGRVSENSRGRAEELLSSMGLASSLGDHPHQLSEGMKQRVNLARALVLNPKVLLLDEPFASLDLMTRRQLQDELLQSCQARNITALLVSHSLEDVAYLSSRVALLTPKPTRLLGMSEIDLPHPRAASPEARFAMLESVQRMAHILSTAATSSERASSASP